MKITDFYPILLHESQFSKDPNRKICAAAFDKQLNRLASGWNGAPRGVHDFSWRYDKPLKEFYVCHAEENLVASAARLGIKLEGSSVLITELHPCARCTRLLIQAGVREIYYPAWPTSGKEIRQDWLDNFEHAKKMLEESGVALISFGDDA